MAWRAARPSQQSVAGAAATTGSAAGSRPAADGRLVEERELECQAQAARPGSGGVDGGEPARGDGDGAHPVSSDGIGGRMPREREVERRSQRLDDLVGKAAQVAPPILERVENGDPAGRITDDQRPAIGPHGLLVGEAEQVADRVGGQLVTARGQQLVEDRLRVAHAAAGEARDERDGLGRRHAAVGGEDPVQLALDQGERKRPEVEALHA